MEHPEIVDLTPRLSDDEGRPRRTWFQTACAKAQNLSESGVNDRHCVYDLEVLKYMTIPGGNETKEAREQRWQALMRAAQDGHSASYARLLSEILPVLRRTVAHKWPRAPDVDDVVQEVLLSVHTFRHTYDPDRPFMHWLMTITTRRFIDAARRRTTRTANETTVDVMPETFSGDETKPNKRPVTIWRPFVELWRNCRTDNAKRWS